MKATGNGRRGSGVGAVVPGAQWQRIDDGHWRLTDDTADVIRSGEVWVWATDSNAGRSRSFFGALEAADMAVRG